MRFTGEKLKTKWFGGVRISLIYSPRGGNSVTEREKKKRSEKKRVR